MHALCKKTEQLTEFLKAVDQDFPVPLSQKQQLSQYAAKLHSCATLCTECRDGRILSIAAGYTDNTVDGLGYISLVATLAEARGQGHASRQFLDIARTKGLRGVHLYAVASNEPAVRMYRRLGFTEYHPLNDPRPDDLHLIHYFAR